MDQAFSVNVSSLTNKQTKKLKTKDFEEKKFIVRFSGEKNQGCTVKIREIRKKPVNVLGFFSKCPGLFWKKTPPIKTLWNPEIHFSARNGGPRRDKTKSPEPVGEWLRHASLRSAPGWLLWLSFVPPGTPILNLKETVTKCWKNFEKNPVSYRSFPIWMNECKCKSVGNS